MTTCAPAKTGAHLYFPFDISQFSEGGKYLTDNKRSSPHLTLKTCPDICPWTLSVPQSSQSSSNLSHVKLSSRNR